MPAKRYFEGGEYDFFVKPVQLDTDEEGRTLRTWVRAPDQIPDVWTVYRYKFLLKEVVSDHLALEPALEEAERLVKQDKTLALLKGNPH